MGSGKHGLIALTVSAQVYRTHTGTSWIDVTNSRVTVTLPPNPTGFQIEQANKEHKEEIHRKILEVLRPEIVKLVELKAFVEHVIELFCENLKNMVPAGKKKKVLPASDDEF